MTTSKVQRLCVGPALRKVQSILETNVATAFWFPRAHHETLKRCDLRGRDGPENGRKSPAALHYTGSQMWKRKFKIQPSYRKISEQA
jgi:hypothetical protein